MVNARGHVLLVDDERALRTAYGRILRTAGFSIEEAGDRRTAIDAISKRRFDAVISDIGLPDGDGIAVLRSAHERDPDLPVLLMTGGGDLRTAIDAVELGAIKYLLKPMSPQALDEAVGSAVSIGRLARVRRRTFDLCSRTPTYDDGPAAFDQALAGLHLAYQPIARWSSKTIFAYEALARSNHRALRKPPQVFAAAERLGRVNDLGRVVRAQVATTLAKSDVANMFVNVHPLELGDPDLYRPDAPLSAYAARVVLELTERAALDNIPGLAHKVSRLRSLGYRIAIDDLGAGYAGLSSLVEVRPDIVKLDMSLVRGIDRDTTKQKLVATITRLCRELGMGVVAEGIETVGDRSAIVDAGCDLMQGFLLARPGAAFPDVDWDRVAVADLARSA